MLRFFGTGTPSSVDQPWDGAHLVAFAVSLLAAPALRESKVLWFTKTSLRGDGAPSHTSSGRCIVGTAAVVFTVSHLIHIPSGGTRDTGPESRAAACYNPRCFFSCFSDMARPDPQARSETTRLTPAPVRMRILVSNDDGYFAPGSPCLRSACVPAPPNSRRAERDRSGSSNSLTLDRPLTVRRAPNGYMYVKGPLRIVCISQSPACWRSFLTSSYPASITCEYGRRIRFTRAPLRPATEGVSAGIPSIAISLVGGEGGHFETAARVACDSSATIQEATAQSAVLLNVNVPDATYAALRGRTVHAARKEAQSGTVVKSTTPRGEVVYWVGAAGGAQDAGEGTDFHAAANGMVSVTPLQVDLTRYSQMQTVNEWLATT